MARGSPGGGGRAAALLVAAALVMAAAAMLATGAVRPTQLAHLAGLHPALHALYGAEAQADAEAEAAAAAEALAAAAEAQSEEEAVAAEPAVAAAGSGATAEGLAEACGRRGAWRAEPLERVCIGKACPHLARPPKSDGKPLPAVWSRRCKRKDGAPRAALLLVRPAVPFADAALRELPKEWRAEVIAFEDAATSASEADALLAKLKGEGRYAMYATERLGDARPLNRLAKLANADVLVVLRGSSADAGPALVRWAAAAAERVLADPSLAVVGTREGAEPGMPPLRDDGLVLRRSALLAAGLVDVSGACPGDADAEEAAWARLVRGFVDFGLRSEVVAVGDEAPGSEAAPVEARRRRRLLQGCPFGEAAAPDIPAANTTVKALCPNMKPPAESAVVVQYFRRPETITRIAGALAEMPIRAEVIVNDDSRSEHGAWMKALEAMPSGAFLVHAPDLHEIRGYNRMGKLADPELLAFMQDDELPKGSWLDVSRTLFAQYPKMALIGGRTGRLDNGPKMEVKKMRAGVPGYSAGPLYCNDGPKFGRGHMDILHTDHAGTVRFRFVYKVNASPLVVRRSVFLREGMFHPGMSCLGEAGISFDFEYSVRMWAHGHQVGLFLAGFKDIGSKEGGTRASAAAFAKRMDTWRRNNLLLYYMYPDFHHTAGTKLADAAVAAEKLPKAAKAFPKKLLG